jgi:hypothetical protein
VIETAAMNEAELSEYCRQRGLYPEQIRVWREACERANDWDRAASRQIARETKDAQAAHPGSGARTARKEKALAEAAALMVLRKKADGDLGPKGGRGRMTLPRIAERSLPSSTRPWLPGRARPPPARNWASMPAPCNAGKPLEARCARIAALRRAPRPGQPADRGGA